MGLRLSGHTPRFEPRVPIFVGNFVGTKILFRIISLYINTLSDIYGGWGVRLTELPAHIPAFLTIPKLALKALWIVVNVTRHSSRYIDVPLYAS